MYHLKCSGLPERRTVPVQVATQGLLHVNQSHHFVVSMPFLANFESFDHVREAIDGYWVATNRRQMHVRRYTGDESMRLIPSRVVDTRSLREVNVQKIISYSKHARSDIRGRTVNTASLYISSTNSTSFQAMPRADGTVPLKKNLAACWAHMILSLREERNPQPFMRSKMRITRASFLKGTASSMNDKRSIKGNPIPRNRKTGIWCAMISRGCRTRLNGIMPIARHTISHVYAMTTEASKRPRWSMDASAELGPSGSTTHFRAFKNTFRCATAANPHKLQLVIGLSTAHRELLVHMYFMVCTKDCRRDDCCRPFANTQSALRPWMLWEPGASPIICFNAGHANH